MMLIFWTIVIITFFIISLRVNSCNCDPIKNYAVCNKCGENVEEDHNYCPNCNTRIKKECNNCGMKISTSWRHCPYCDK